MNEKCKKFNFKVYNILNILDKGIRFVYIILKYYF